MHECNTSACSLHQVALGPRLLLRPAPAPGLDGSKRSRESPRESRTGSIQLVARKEKLLPQAQKGFRVAGQFCLKLMGAGGTGMNSHETSARVGEEHAGDVQLEYQLAKLAMNEVGLVLMAAVMDDNA